MATSPEDVIREFERLGPPLSAIELARIHLNFSPYGVAKRIEAITKSGLARVPNYPLAIRPIRHQDPTGMLRRERETNGFMTSATREHHTNRS